MRIHLGLRMSQNDVKLSGLVSKFSNFALESILLLVLKTVLPERIVAWRDQSTWFLRAWVFFQRQLDRREDTFSFVLCEWWSTIWCCFTPVTEPIRFVSVYRQLLPTNSCVFSQKNTKHLPMILQPSAPDQKQQRCESRVRPRPPSRWELKKTILICTGGVWCSQVLAIRPPSAWVAPWLSRNIKGSLFLEGQQVKDINI